MSVGGSGGVMRTFAVLFLNDQEDYLLQSSDPTLGQLQKHSN